MSTAGVTRPWGIPVAATRCRCAVLRIAQGVHTLTKHGNILSQTTVSTAYRTTDRCQTIYAIFASILDGLAPPQCTALLFPECGAAGYDGHSRFPDPPSRKATHRFLTQKPNIDYQRGSSCLLKLNGCSNIPVKL